LLDRVVSDVLSQLRMSTLTPDSFIQKTATIGVVGLGYVGLPLIRALVTAGFRTLGFDVDPAKIARLQAGQSYIGHVASEWIANCVRQGKFAPTADMGRWPSPMRS
jgi:UDP-N-acetyl-D-glucosamine dehydrogenase